MEDNNAFAAAEQLSEHLASHYDLGQVTSPALGGTGVPGINLRKSLAQSVDSQGSADNIKPNVKVINSAQQSSALSSGNSLQARLLNMQKSPVDDFLDSGSAGNSPGIKSKKSKMEWNKYMGREPGASLLNLKEWTMAMFDRERKNQLNNVELMMSKVTQLTGEARTQFENDLQEHSKGHDALKKQHEKYVKKLENLSKKDPFP